MSDIYNIPTGVSNILYYYLYGQSDYDLDRLRKQYEAEYAAHPERENVGQILLTIIDISDSRRLGIQSPQQKQLV